MKDRFQKNELPDHFPDKDAGLTFDEFLSIADRTKLLNNLPQPHNIVNPDDLNTHDLRKILDPLNVQIQYGYTDHRPRLFIDVETLNLLP